MLQSKEASPFFDVFVEEEMSMLQTLAQYAAPKKVQTPPPLLTRPVSEMTSSKTRHFAEASHLLQAKEGLSLFEAMQQPDHPINRASSASAPTSPYRDEDAALVDQENAASAPPAVSEEVDAFWRGGAVFGECNVSAMPVYQDIYYAEKQAWADYQARVFKGEEEEIDVYQLPPDLTEQERLLYFPDGEWHSAAKPQGKGPLKRSGPTPETPRKRSQRAMSPTTPRRPLHHAWLLDTPATVRRRAPPPSTSPVPDQVTPTKQRVTFAADTAMAVVKPAIADAPMVEDTTVVEERMARACTPEREKPTLSIVTTPTSKPKKGPLVPGLDPDANPSPSLKHVAATPGLSDKFMLNFTFGSPSRDGSPPASRVRSKNTTKVTPEAMSLRLRSLRSRAKSADCQAPRRCK